MRLSVARFSRSKISFLRQAQEIDGEIDRSFRHTAATPAYSLSMGWQLQLLEIVLQQQGGFVFLRHEAPPSESSVL